MLPPRVIRCLRECAHISGTTPRDLRRQYDTTRQLLADMPPDCAAYWLRYLDNPDLDDVIRQG